MDLGRDFDTTRLFKLWEKIKPGHCCALIYTSGTTGNPKGVMLSHDNLFFSVVSEFSLHTKYTGINQKAEEERALSYLPLSHVAGMMIDIVMPMVCTCLGPSWLCVFFTRPYDLKIGTLVERLRAVRPAHFIGVPRVWEKIAEKLKALGATKPYLIRVFSGWCKRVLLAHQKTVNWVGLERNTLVMHLRARFLKR